MTRFELLQVLDSLNKEMMLRVYDLIVNRYGSHVARSYLCLLAGFDVLQSGDAKDKVYVRRPAAPCMSQSDPQQSSFPHRVGEGRSWHS